MPSVGALSTRTLAAYPRLHQQTSTSSTQTQTTGLMFFRHSVQRLTMSSHYERNARRTAVVEALRISRDPIEYIGEVLDQCVIERRAGGLDIAIDVLSHFGINVIEFARQFWKKDVDRWSNPATHKHHHVHDDIWYVLLRAVGASKLDAWQKIPMLSYCAADGTPVVREASVRALADVGNPIAIRLIKRLGGTDTSTMVREAAEEVLVELEE